jgi:hypothetical protein
MLLVHEGTKQAVPVPSLINVDQLLRDFQAITDSARSRTVAAGQVALSILRNIRPENLPKTLGAWDLVKIMDGHTGGKMGIAKKKRYSWRVLFIGGMWFQDLFNYDFRRTEMCIIPYATQMGEISFCAYNTGVGWRKIVEEMFRSATLAEWYKKNGRHTVYARGKSVPLPTLPSDAPVPLVAMTPPAAAPASRAAKAMLPVFTALIK